MNGRTLVLGGGLTGLSAACFLTRAGVRTTVLEQDETVGGLSKTIEKNGFRFDLGGHRFFTRDPELDRFVRDLMQDELVTVDRSSKILMRGRFFDYPLKPWNAMFGLGIPTTARILADYGWEKCRRLVRDDACVSLEDWVVRNFGRTMFDIYFRIYSEKVWGIDCRSISAEWVDKRINGLSLAKAVGNAFRRVSGKQLPTLADEFLYPRLGIGRLSDRLKEEVELRNDVLLNARVEGLYHEQCRIGSIGMNMGGRTEEIACSSLISSIPLPSLVRMLRPAPPADVLSAAAKLQFRDLVVVAVMIDRPRVTDQTWIYIPEKSIPFGRIHEPTNWSEDMAPEGRTLLVIEYFSFRGDRIWNETDENLSRITAEHLEKLGFIAGRNEVIDTMVVRVPKAYPLFQVGYDDLCRVLYEYCDRFENLHLAGRSGLFRYYNMDHSLESGMETARALIARAAAHPEDEDLTAMVAGCG